MGAYIVYDIDFLNKANRLKFEKMFDLKTKHIEDYYTDTDFEESGIYNAGWMGYAEPFINMEEALKKDIKIKFFAWIAISDRNTHWEKIRGRW